MTAPRQIIPGTTRFGARLAAAVKAKAAEPVAEREAQGKSFLGREAVLAQSPFDRPVSDDERGDLDPKVACRDKWRRGSIRAALTARSLSSHRPPR